MKSNIELLKIAANLVIEVGAGNVDKSGLPEILHPIGVYGKLMNFPIDVQIVGLLHDIIEDHGDRVTLLTLAELGFPSHILTAIDLLTHLNGEPYVNYIHNLSQNEIARTVKLADIEMNMFRLDHGVCEKDALRMRTKWSKAIGILRGAV